MLFIGTTLSVKDFDILKKNPCSITDSQIETCAKLREVRAERHRACEPSAAQITLS